MEGQLLRSSRGSKVTEDRNTQVPARKQCAGSWRCCAREEGMTLHIVKNKTTEMLCLPGVGITDVFSRAWEH